MPKLTSLDDKPAPLVTVEERNPNGAEFEQARQIADQLARYAAPYASA